MRLLKTLKMFCGITCTACGQHVELRRYRQLRDRKDVDTQLQWLTVHSPIPTDVDLFIVLIQLSKQADHLYMYQPRAGKCPHKVFSISCVQRRLSEASSTFLFVHATTDLRPHLPCTVKVRRKHSPFFRRIRTYNIVWSRYSMTQPLHQIPCHL